MSDKTFSVKLHDNNPAWMPEKSHPDDAGWDLKARAYCEVYYGEVGGEVEIKERHFKVLHPHKRSLIKTGVYLGLEPGWEAQIRPRSGLALKDGLIVVNSPGTIDAGYRNEIGVILSNIDDVAYCLRRGARIAQMIIKQVPQVHLTPVEDLDETDRGLAGYGSTGI